MIELDRTAAIPITEQLVEQLRYHLAAGRYRTGERLTSTRKLADQLGVSFHTVRKAYQRLEEEGLLSSKRGGGFYAAEPPALSSSERRERGASIVQDALQRLVALGLSNEETEYLFGASSCSSSSRRGCGGNLFSWPRFASARRRSPSNSPASSKSV